MDIRTATTLRKKIIRTIRETADADDAADKIIGGIGYAECSAWRPIETAPKPQDWLRTKGRFLIGHWWQPVDEDGEPSGEGDWAWVQVVSMTSSGWHVWSSGFAGWHGTATFPVHGNATHWMPLPTPPSIALVDKAQSKAAK